MLSSEQQSNPIQHRSKHYNNAIGQQSSTDTYFEVGVVLGIPVGNGRDAVGEVLTGCERVEPLPADGWTIMGTVVMLAHIENTSQQQTAT